MVQQVSGFASVRAVSHPTSGFRALVATPPPPAPRPARLGPENVRQLFWAPALADVPHAPDGAAVASSSPGRSGSGGDARALSGGAAGALAGARPDPLLALEWRAAYGALAADAQELGIPASAIPRLPDADADLTLELLQARQRHLQDMVASFLSSGL